MSFKQGLVLWLLFLGTLSVFAVLFFLITNDRVWSSTKDPLSEATPIGITAGHVISLNSPVPTESPTSREFPTVRPFPTYGASPNVECQSVEFLTHLDEHVQAFELLKSAIPVDRPVSDSLILQLDEVAIEAAEVPYPACADKMVTGMRLYMASFILALDAHNRGDSEAVIKYANDSQSGQRIAVQELQRIYGRPSW